KRLRPQLERVQPSRIGHRRRTEKTQHPTIIGPIVCATMCVPSATVRWRPDRIARRRRKRQEQQPMTTQQISRRALCKGLSGTAMGAAVLALPGLARADSHPGSPESVQVAEIYQLQAAFHRAKTTQDLDLMMSLWAPDATLNVQGDPKSPYIGAAALSAF